MTGSGAGGFFIILWMFWLPPRYLLLPILVLAGAAALLTAINRDEKTGLLRCPPLSLAALGLSVLLSLGAVLLWGGIRVSDYKSISAVRMYPDSKLVHHSYGPGGEYHVYASRYFHFAPGLSDNAALKIPIMLTQPFWGLFIDGSGPIGIMGKLREEEQEYMDYLPMAAPYTVLAKPEVLLVNLSGGINAQVARYKEAKGITIVEPSGELIRLLQEDPNVSRFTGNLLEPSGEHGAGGIQVIQGEGRAFCVEHKGAYDLIEISLVDSIGLSDSGGYPIHEDFKYTVEAFQEYFASLKEGGILSVTVWDHLNPPRNVLKLLNTVICAMEAAGFPDPEQSLYSFGLLMSTSTILVKRGGFTPEELAKLNRFAESCSFEFLYVPGMELPQRDLDILIDAYRRHFERRGAPLVDGFTNADLYRAAIPALFAGQGERIEAEYIFDIRPIRDSRPYYSGFLKLRNLPMYLDRLEGVTEEWGYLLLLGMLVQGALLGFIVILIPVVCRRKTLFKNSKGALGVILYFAGLGLGYMLIEIYLIQRLGVFLSNPTYSASIVITVMLIFSALGNLSSSLLKRLRTVMIPLACACIAGGFCFYIFGLDAFLVRFISAPLAVRIIAAVGVIAPPAFFMGIPYPNGLDTLQERKPHLLPWAWGMNGGLSLAGSALARILAVASGFPVLLALGIAVYVMVGLLFPLSLVRKLKD